MFIGCAIPFGMQLVIAIPLAIMMRVSKLGATMGTFITNPVSIFFIYPVQTYLVNKMLFGGSLTYEKLADTEWTWAAVRRLGADAMVSFFLGGPPPMGLVPHVDLWMMPVGWMVVAGLILGSFIDLDH